MNTLELSDILCEDSYTSLLNPSVKPLNHFIEDVLKMPSITIVNLDSCDEPGSHWVVVYATLDGTIEYFDSYGIKPETLLINKFQNTSCEKLIYSSVFLQGFSTVCGQWCLCYVLTRSRNYTFNEVIASFLLCETSSERDLIINYVINSRFKNNLKTTLQVVDKTFLQNYV